jgi:hypothetical protein
MAAESALAGMGKEGPDVWNVLSMIVAVAGTCYGIYYTYKVNRAGDNHDFVGRSISMGFPLGIRFLAAVVPLVIVLSVIGHALRIPYGAWTLVFVLGLMFVYFWRLAHHLRWIASSPGAAEV